MTRPQYNPNPHHRNGNPNKSQWQIGVSEEEECFRMAYDFDWIEGRKGWGLYFVGTKPDWLGISRDGSKRLLLAKFVSDDAAGPWHGYPADYRSNQHDIPAEKVLNKWLTDSGLSRAKLRKIARGQPCNP